ncbi:MULTISPECIES: MATE family efflux transporter [Sphingobium]|jgi:putative MATE family efflux protein|uniref:MATE family efflux transporter n=1 Tax=Sphingobium TaxID=165695 RepID=UPI000C5CC813|nr:MULTISPECIES: MATE family efflux transporter [Sphingobium]MAX14002.1 MATE family efflux transporter [Sphingobium sp.]MEE2740897.1 MATE family efflux transporter [Pseudomonadota bacterium]MBS47479.1 MATE family efflux transporter [Sphingobium sp.]MCC4257254.1 MATE family efflux transporter [Sphingobium lactosutens]HCW62654.1 MATE family efflux transporter [Sphingobium sp.]
MATGKSGSKDLTQGAIGSTLLLFAMPTLASNILQSLNGSINAIWVGRFLGAQALAATANANIIMFLMFSVVFGFGMASTVVVAQSVGAKDIDAARRAFGTAVGFCSMLGLGVAIAGWIGAPALLRLLATPQEAFDLALVYLRVIFFAMPATLLVVMIMMGLRGAGDARTPLIFMIVSVAIDLVLNPVLILGLGPVPAFGIAGSAAATAAAGFISLIGVVAFIYAKDMPLRLRGAELRYLWPAADQMRVLLGKGLPMGLQMIVMSLSGLVMIGLVNREGLLVTAAYGAAQQIWTYLQMPAMAMGAAVSAMAAQNIGAARWDRISRITGYGLGYLLAVTSAMVAVILLFHEPLLALFLGNNQAAIEAAWTMQLLASWSFIFFGCTMILFGVMRANGVVVAPLLILIFTLFAVRLGFYYLAYPVVDANALWLSFPAGSLTALLLASAVYLHGGWRKAKLMAPVHAEQCRESVNSETEPAGRIAPVG